MSLRAKISYTLFLLALLFGGCQTQQNQGPPSIEFTKIPPAAQGGRERVDTISGRVANYRPGQKIVVYARSGPWWVQPWPEHPFLLIQSDSTWSTETHLGFEYAALLVDPGYKPASTMDTLPNREGLIAAIVTTKGTGPVALAPTKPLEFSGYNWKVRTISSDRGGINNLYSADNAWTDKDGALHLRIHKDGAKWSCAEVILDHSLGYGTYTAVVRDISRLEPASVLSLVTFDDWGGEEHYRELDMEFGRWGDGEKKSNAQFGIQPFYVPGNLAMFNSPPGPLTTSMKWEPNYASFRAVKGRSLTARTPLISEHSFTSGVPSHGRETFQFIFYVVASDKFPEQNDSEVVIEKFQYLP